MLTMLLKFETQNDLDAARDAIGSGSAALRNVKSMSDIYDRRADDLNALCDQMYNTEPVKVNDLP